MYFETTIFTSGLTERFCLLCGYGIEHTEIDHIHLCKFRPDAEYLIRLKKGDLVPTTYGLAEVVSFKHRVFDGINYSLDLADGDIIGSEIVVEYATAEYKYREEIYLSCYEDVEMDWYIKQRLTTQERARITIIASLEASAVLQRYKLKAATTDEIEYAIEEELQTEEHKNVLLDWVSRV